MNPLGNHRSGNNPQPATRSKTGAPDSAGNPARRVFLGNALKIGAGSLLLGSSLRNRAADGGSAVAGSSLPLAPTLELPSRVFIAAQGTDFVSAARQGSRFTSGQTAVHVLATSAGQDVRVTCPTGSLARMVLRWETTFPADTLFLGDHWERGYGDLQWRFLQP